MSGMKKTRPEAPNSACLRPDVCQDLTSACARSACQGEKKIAVRKRAVDGVGIILACPSKT